MFFQKSEHGSGFPKWLIPVGAIVGIALILFGGGLGKSGTASAGNDPDAKEEIAEYQTYLENRVRLLCESSGGVSDVTVIVTLAGGFSSVYATEEKNGNETYVILGSGSSESPLLLCQEAPEIAGIGVVCRGGGNGNNQKELTELICAAFHIPSNRVRVTEKK